YTGSTSEFISAEAPNAFTYMLGPYFSLDNPICFNPTLKWIFLSFLLFLEGLSIVWFSMIVRVAYGVIRGGNAEDTRSEEEDEAEVEDHTAPHGSAHLAAKDGAPTDAIETGNTPGL